MTGYTPVKRFRFPQRGELGTDVDIANLMADFDIEVHNQINTKVKRVTRAPFGRMWRYSGDLPLPGDLWTKMTWEAASGELGDLANNRFTATPAVGPGLFIVQCQVTVDSVASTCVGIGLRAEIGGSMPGFMERKTRREGNQQGLSCVIGLPVVGDWVQWSVGVYGPGSTAHTSWAECHIWKVGDLT